MTAFILNIGLFDKYIVNDVEQMMLNVGQGDWFRRSAADGGIRRRSPSCSCRTGIA